MPSRILNVLLATSLLAHSVLGCCWHHAHGHECAEATGAPATPCRADHHCGAEHRCAPALAVDGSHEHSAPCDELDCSFIKAAPAQLELSHLPNVALAVTDASPAAAGRQAADRELSDDEARLSGAALRAVLRVWLI